MLEDLTELLIDHGINMDDVVRGPFTDEPIDQTALVPSPSTEPPAAYCGPIYEPHRLAIQVRRLDGVVARNRALEIWRQLVTVAQEEVGGSIFHEIVPQSTPFWVDEDVKGAQVYGLNVEVRSSPT